MEMEDDQRTKLLQMDARQMHVFDCCHSRAYLTNVCRRDVATFVNSYPSLDITQELMKGEFSSGAPIFLQVNLAREADEDENPSAQAQTVVAPLYPVQKMANWWLVVGEPSTKQLLVIKRVTVTKSLTVKLEFSLPKGKHSLKLYAICDSYVGADHDIALDEIDVAEGDDSDSDEDIDSDEDME